MTLAGQFVLHVPETIALPLPLLCVFCTHVVPFCLLMSDSPPARDCLYRPNPWICPCAPRSESIDLKIFRNKWRPSARTTVTTLPIRHGLSAVNHAPENSWMNLRPGPAAHLADSFLTLEARTPVLREFEARNKRTKRKLAQPVDVEARTKCLQESADQTIRQHWCTADRHTDSFCTKTRFPQSNTHFNPDLTPQRRRSVLSSFESW